MTRLPTEVPPTIGYCRGLWWWWWRIDVFGLPVDARGPFATRADALADIADHDTS